MTYDALIIGNGIAGSSLALFLAKEGQRVCLITKGTSLEETNTAKAQGGIVFRGEEDSTDLLVHDILEASGQTASPRSARILARLGPALVARFLVKELRIPFERKADGTWDLFQEGAHSRRRILHVKDYTGRVIQRYLNEAVQKEENITLRTGTFALELITSFQHAQKARVRYGRPECLGAYVLQGENIFPIFARATILATGGLNALFRHSSGGPWATGDGFALSLKAQVPLADMERIQFHPTLLYEPQKPHALLLSEALRGEGAVLCDEQGNPFLERFHPLGSLAPRDVVAQAVFEVMRERGLPHVFLDLRPLGERLRLGFPEIFEELLQRGFDPLKEPVPVVPGAHFACGGVLTDTWGRTSLARLYAVGEVACSGVHGANRLASTSLLEGLTFAFRAAQAIVRHEAPLAPPSIVPYPYRVRGTEDLARYMALRQAIQEVMWEEVGLKRREKGLQRAHAILLELKKEILDLRYSLGVTPPLEELANMVDTGIAVVVAALRSSC
ncbi:MAG: FAD-dependent oxidoreductase [Candidatus Caldatribacterium sp.]|uniref:L-aspartate oxidase n=1 Tax=Candidatus Caldatribacterium sp. TaxID=2282143 RepID=UPI00299831DA|nr:FAD-dependent oxidoreductase [Candidatus Caldatribacterium sp.]MCX7730154.1 FAD-dependent oxidoreductase [Candidatus Caldatribacterium sp.]MDW8081760.1 FAD-dependent oxidoreductase [Candidatus Calescibacterium sp.]